MVRTPADAEKAAARLAKWDFRLDCLWQEVERAQARLADSDMFGTQSDRRRSERSLSSWLRQYETLKKQRDMLETAVGPDIARLEAMLERLPPLPAPATAWYMLGKPPHPDHLWQFIVGIQSHRPCRWVRFRAFSKVGCPHKQDHWKQLVETDKFPPPNLSGPRVRWDPDEVYRWYRGKLLDLVPDLDSTAVCKMDEFAAWRRSCYTYYLDEEAYWADFFKRMDIPTRACPRVPCSEDADAARARLEATPVRVPL